MHVSLSFKTLLQGERSSSLNRLLLQVGRFLDHILICMFYKDTNDDFSVVQAICTCSFKNLTLSLSLQLQVTEQPQLVIFFFPASLEDFQCEQKNIFL
jgi:hypothetical protein